ncbi:MAG: hypothetical protein ABF243_07125 [Celeribacter marinus]
MMLMEQTQVPVGVLPLELFKDHLRLGTGFGVDSVQDGMLETYLRAAIAAIEARISKALIARDYSYTVSAWRDLAAQSLPVSPVSAITAFVIVDRAGGEAIIDPSNYMLEPDVHRPRLVSLGFMLPQVPVGGAARIEFTAGFGPAWSDVPGDLAQAVFLLAAHYYEHRFEGAARERDMPFGVAPLLDRYRNIRIFGGRS